MEVSNNLSSPVQRTKAKGKDKGAHRMEAGDATSSPVRQTKAKTQDKRDVQAELTHENAVVQKYVQATDQLTAIAEEFKATRGELRRTIATLREALTGVLDGDCSQLALPKDATAGLAADGQATSTQQPIFVRRMVYRSAKTITTPVVHQACDLVCSGEKANIDLGQPDWRSTLRDRIVAQIKEHTITKRQYVDVTPKGMKKTRNPTTQQQQRSASNDHPAVSIATELHVAKQRLKELNQEETKALAKPKRRVDTLTGRLQQEMSQCKSVRVRLPSGRTDAPDRFVNLKDRVRKPNLTMRVLVSLLDRALGECQCLDGVTETVLTTLQQWMEDNDRETEVVTINKGAVSRS